MYNVTLNAEISKMFPVIYVVALSVQCVCTVKLINTNVTHSVFMLRKQQTFEAT